MLHFRQRHQSGEVGITHIDGRRKIDRYDQCPPGRPDFVQPAVGFSSTQKGILNTEFIAYPIGAQYVQPVPGIEEMGQVLRRIERFQRKVALLRCIELAIPFTVAIRLTQQRDAAHQRTGIRLRGRAFRKAVPCGHPGFDHHVVGVITEGHQGGRAPNNPVLTVRHHRTESSRPVSSGPLAGNEFHGRLEFGMQGTVPSHCSLGILPFIVGFSIPPGPLSLLEPPAGMEVHESRVELLAGHVVPHNRLG